MAQLSKLQTDIMDGGVNDLVRQIKEWYVKSDSYHSKFLKNLKQDYNFYDGDQWEEESLRKLKGEGRPALTFNRIKPIIDLVMGIHEQQKLDIKVLGRSSEDILLANAINALVKYVCDRNDFEVKQATAFFDAIVCGRGWICIEQSFDNNWLNGETIIKRIDPAKIRIPINNEIDLSDCEYLLYEEEFSRKKIKELWPDKADELEYYFENENKQIESGETDYGLRSSAQRSESSTADSSKVIEAQWIEHVPKRFIIDTLTGDITEIENEETARQLVAKMPNLKIIKKNVKKVMFARICGNVLLESGESPYNDPYFSFVPIFCYRGREIDYGIVRNLIDPQREANKRRSQLLHIINTSANTGWIIDSGDQDFIEQIKNFGSTPGFIAIKNPATKYERIFPPPMPVPIFQLEQEAKDDLKGISGINADLLGFREATQSGVAIDLRIRQGVTIISRIFANFRASLKQMARLIISRIRQFMTIEEMQRILGPDYSLEIIQKIKSNDVMKYDIEVSQSPYSPTMRLANFMVLTELKKMGINIPDKFIIEASDLPQKEEIIKALEAAQGGQGIQGATGAMGIMEPLIKTQNKEVL